MKRLWLVGESLPLREDRSHRKAIETQGLPATLVPLDPRHGVFPNLVMKPLFSAGFSLSQSHSDQLLPFFQQMKEVVSDQSVRRFNIFENRPTRSKGKGGRTLADNPETETFKLDDDVTSSRIKSFDRENDLWLVFGHQTNFGLFWWLIDKETAGRASKTQIKGFSDRFAAASCGAISDRESGDLSQLASRIGFLHRLCTGASSRPTLEAIVTQLKPAGAYSAEEITDLLRAMVPLLHNEGYQDGRNATGNSQGHFVRLARGKDTSGDLYWQVMGNAIATRILGNFVE